MRYFKRNMLKILVGHTSSVFSLITINENVIISGSNKLLLHSLNNYCNDN